MVFWRVTLMSAVGLLGVKARARDFATFLEIALDAAPALAFALSTGHNEPQYADDNFMPRGPHSSHARRLCRVGIAVPTACPVF